MLDALYHHPEGTLKDSSEINLPPDRAAYPVYSFLFERGKHIPECKTIPGLWGMVTA